MVLEIPKDVMEIIIKNLRDKGFRTIEERDNVFKIADALESCMKDELMKHNKNLINS